MRATQDEHGDPETHEHAHHQKRTKQRTRNTPTRPETNTTTPVDTQSARKQPHTGETAPGPKRPTSEIAAFYRKITNLRVLIIGRFTLTRKGFNYKLPKAT